jgi:UDP-N-acetylglucosamine:LPS N-acetylglucosamine transferase
MTLMSAKRGYNKAIKKYKRRYNEDNIRLVSFAIRNEAFAISMDKRENRRALGLDENKLTVVLFEGGYGLGKMGKITRLLVEKDLPVNIVAICGKNEKLYNTLKCLQTKENTTLIVEGFCDKTLQYLAAADLSGQMTLTLSHPLKIPQPNSVTDSEITTRSRFTHPRKAVSSILATESGMVISFSDVH